MLKICPLFILMLFSCESFADKVKLRGQGITDDEIASAIKNPCPPSVSKTINYIKNTYNEDEIEVLYFRNNNITNIGAKQILDFAQNLQNLKKISFNTNRIYDWRGQGGFEDFEKALITLLDKPKFETLDIRINGIANISWYQQISSKTKNAYKIRWAK